MGQSANIPMEMYGYPATPEDMTTIKAKRDGDYATYFFAILYYFATGVIEGLIAFLLLIRIPTDPKNARFLGYSFSRLAMMLGLGFIILFFLVLVIWYWRSSIFRARLTQLFDRVLATFGLALPVLIASLGIFVIGPYVKLLTYTPLETIPERVAPFVIYTATRITQAALVSLWLAILKTKQGEHWRYTPKKVTWILSSAAVILIFANISIHLIRLITQNKEIWALIHYFELSYENNIPTYFSALLLGMAGVLLSMVARQTKQETRYRWYWYGLSFTFLFLAIDEVMGFHERIGEIVKLFINEDDLLFSDWAYGGIIVVGILFFIFLPFLKQLPPKTKLGFFIAATIYVGAALGLEIVGSLYLFNIEYNSWVVVLSTTIEEALEMVGVIIFIQFISEYLIEHRAES